MPTIDIPDKICPHCGGTKWWTKIDKRLNKNGVLKEYVSHTCSKIKSEMDKRFISNNPESRKKIYRKYRDKIKHTEAYKKVNNERAKNWLLVNKEIMMNSDRYAKYQLGENSTTEQRKRYIVYLKCLRQLKQLKNEKENN